LTQDTLQKDKTISEKDKQINSMTLENNKRINNLNIEFNEKLNKMSQKSELLEQRIIDTSKQLDQKDQIIFNMDKTLSENENISKNRISSLENRIQELNNIIHQKDQNVEIIQINNPIDPISIQKDNESSKYDILQAKYEESIKEGNEKENTIKLLLKKNQDMAMQLMEM